MAGLKREIGKFIPHEVKFHLRQALHRGGAFECPLCGSKLAALKPHGGLAPVLDELHVVGGMLREEDRCPVCHGMDRTRLIYHYLFDRLGVGGGGRRILHIAPEVGLYMRLSQTPGLVYVCGDIEPGRYAFAKGVERLDATEMSHYDDSFDIVVCSHVMEHIPDDARAFAEIARVLRPGGAALFMVPVSLKLERTLEDPALTSPAERLARFGQSDHVRIYARDFAYRIEAAGFAVEAYDAFAAAPERAAALRLNPLERLYVGVKKGAA
jgi:SAM-dependent methyltransferase